jgi:UDP-2,3-diacylglucosamine hydrolase
MPEYQPVLSALRELVDSGTPVYVMHGNRDFLLGKAFEQATGCRLIGDPLVIDLHGSPTLLMHGDLLCTDDSPYQSMRKQLRDPEWIAAFLHKTPQERIDFARDLRERSRKETGEKAESIMDVNADTVEHYLRKYQVARLIHGHTHRPATHQHRVDGTIVPRYVLPEWHETGGLLRCDEQDCQALSVS